MRASAVGADADPDERIPVCRLFTQFRL